MDDAGSPRTSDMKDVNEEVFGVGPGVSLSNCEGQGSIPGLVIRGLIDAPFELPSPTTHGTESRPVKISGASLGTLS
jgi:hypothetical protein